MPGCSYERDVRAEEGVKVEKCNGKNEDNLPLYLSTFLPFYLSTFLLSLGPPGLKAPDHLCTDGRAGSSGSLAASTYVQLPLLSLT